jgi:hypothetical protein
VGVYGGFTRVMVWSAMFDCVPNVSCKRFGYSKSKLLDSEY